MRPKCASILLALSLAVTAAPALAQTASPSPPAIQAEVTTKTAAQTAEEEEIASLTIGSMLGRSKPIPKSVMFGLIAAAMISWVLLVMKIIEFFGLGRTTTRFLAAFREQRNLPAMMAVATDGAYAGNPMADMAAAALHEIDLVRKAGLDPTGTHRDMALENALSAISAVQAQLTKRLSGGMQFQASLGAIGPFVGLFGTVFGIMTSFIGIVQSNSTSLIAVAPGIAEALLATGIGLGAAIPAVVFYNFMQTRISAYGARTEGFISELMTSLNRQLHQPA